MDKPKNARSFGHVVTDSSVTASSVRQPVRRSHATKFLIPFIGLSVLATSGCFVGPAQSPHYAVEKPHTGPPPTETDDEVPPSPATKIPESAVWFDCNGASVASAPEGYLVDCSSYSSELQLNGALDIQLEVVRLRADETPEDASPVFYLSDPDTPASDELLRGAVPREILSNHPVIAVDFRGQGVNSPRAILECLTEDYVVRLSTLSKEAEFPEQLEEGTRNAQESAYQCIATQSDAHLYFGIDAQLKDLENLQAQWNLQTMDFWGVGVGAHIAAAFAERFPQSVRTVTADSPIYPGLGQLVNSERGTEGLVESLTLLHRECSPDCGTAPPLELVNSALLAAQDSLDPTISAAYFPDLMAHRLTWLPPRRDTAERAEAVRAFWTELSEASRGDFSAWFDEQDRFSWDTLRLFTTCSAEGIRATNEEITALAEQLEPELGPLSDARALGITRCLNWPQGNNTATLSLNGAKVLVVSPAADPRVGLGSYGEEVAQNYAQQGAETAVVSWQQMGHGAVAASDCVARTVNEFLAETALPASLVQCS